MDVTFFRQQFELLMKSSLAMIEKLEGTSAVISKQLDPFEVKPQKKKNKRKR